jgi:PAS domain S-box-containing protein
LSSGLPSAHIVVVEPEAGASLTGALARLGPEVRLETLPPDASGPLGPHVDLVVLDLAAGSAAERLLRELPPGAPPVIAVTDDSGSEAALATFRLGAADCLVRGRDLPELLPAAALEQIRRRRAALERRRLEQRVADLTRYNQDIIQNLNSALLVVDPQGRITFANPVAEEVLGAPGRDLAGRGVFELFPGEPSSHPLSRSLTQGARLRGVEAVALRAGGSRVPVGMSSAPLVAADGTRLGAVAIFQDLSEVKTLERQMLQTERMASIGQLAAGVAHEINNPVGFIHANLLQMSEYVDELGRLWDLVGELRKAVDAADPAEIREAAQHLGRRADEVDASFLLSDLATALRESQEGSERIRHIVQDLRVFAHDDPELELADVNQCLDSTANIVWTMLKHAARLEKDYGEIPPISCRPMQLKQVFMNLLVNAYQAIESGPARDTPGRVGLRTRADASGVTISVMDTGIGISAEHLDRIFEPFFTTKEVGEGMGLGLSTSFDIVRRHGGRLRAESEPGRGTTFEVFLPLEPPESG